VAPDEGEEEAKEPSPCTWFQKGTRWLHVDALDYEGGTTYEAFAIQSRQSEQRKCNEAREL